jgi:hypothetical protein
MSNPKCKLNDICFILKALRQSNIGKVVETVEYLGYFQKDEPFTWSGEVWTAFDTDHHWVVKGNLETHYGTSELSYIMDSWLLPMKPEDSGEGVYEVEDIPEDIAA